MATHNKKNLYIAGVTTLVIFVVACICFDFTYYLNDDCMLESILSGQLSGTPSAMTYYMSVVLSGILSFLYKIVSAFSWLGAFMCGSIFLCSFLIIYRAICILNNKRLVLMVAIAFILGFILPNLVLPHYTLVAAIYCMTGIFYLMSADKPEDYKMAIRMYWPSAALMLMGYLVRSNVFYMSLVFFGMAAMYKLISYGFSSIKSYVSIIAIFAIGFGILFMADKLAYSSAEYKEYIYYNQIRTKLYDYGYINIDDAAMEHYKLDGIDEETVLLYKNYDMKLDAGDNIEVMNKLMSYEKNAEVESGFNNSLYLYKEKLLKRNSNAVASDYPNNYLILALYVLVFFVMLTGKDIKGITYLAMLFAVRSGLWIYLLHKGRYPERITLSLYLLELAILGGLMVLWGKKRGKLSLGSLSVSVVILVFLGSAYVNMQSLTTRYSQQISVNKEDDVVYSYMNAHSGLYLLDTYSVVNRTTRAVGRYSEADNYMILGGWTCGHPLVQQKMVSLGYDSVSDALLSDGVYYISKRDADMSADGIASFLDCSYELVDVIEDDYYVYSFSR